MRKWLIAAGAALALAACATAPAELTVAPDAPWIAAAIADPDRPQADRDRDAARKPAETLAFARVRPGMTVLEILPGGGYFTRLLAEAVGPQGKVYAYVPTEVVNQFNMGARARELAAAYPNVEYASDPLAQRAPAPFADMAFTVQNYHDFRIPMFGGNDIAAVNRAIWSTLKPGGAYVIIDHAAVAGSGAAAVNTLHRIEADTVRREVEAAGFVFEGESDLLGNPADPKTANVFDPSIRGRTDQFMLRFRKPAR